MSTALTSPFPDDRFSLAALHEPVDPSWAPVVAAFWNSVEGMRLQALLGERIAAGACVYPPNPLRALALTPLAEVRAIIIGQDPYHGPGQAEGLAFSVPRGVRVPPSLRNIFKEIHREYGGAGIVLDVPPSGQRHRTSGSLVPWAKQGVLLLNAVWTVESGQPAAHKGLGWEALTRAVLQAVATTAPPSVFLLWGAHAQALQGGLDLRRHRVLAANHPSPLSALRGATPFLGCNHFRLCNDWLTSVGRPIINWFAD